MLKLGKLFLNTRLRSWLYALVAATLIILPAWLAPQQIPAVIYKLLLPLLVRSDTGTRVSRFPPRRRRPPAQPPRNGSRRNPIRRG